MKYVRFLSCIIACSVFSSINVRADTPKEKTTGGAASDYFSKPLYFYGNAKIIEIDSNEKNPYVELEIIGNISSFEDRPFRQHENVTLNQMINYAKNHNQINYLITSFDESREVIFESTSVQQKSPNIIRINLKYSSKAEKIQAIAKSNQNVTITLLNY